MNESWFPNLKSCKSCPQNLKLLHMHSLGTVHLIFRGGGGAWVFGPSQNIFFGQNRSKIIFFAGPSAKAGLFFFHNQKLHL